jgi:hypothetical protein
MIVKIYPYTTVSTKPIKIASFDDLIMLPTNHVTSPMVAMPAIR